MARKPLMHNYIYFETLEVGPGIAGVIRTENKSSPIRSVGDIAGKIVGYETNGSSSQYDAIDFMRNFGVNAKLALTGGANATFNHLKAGIIDIGWGSPPFGVDRVAKGDIRNARANDVPKI